MSQDQLFIEACQKIYKTFSWELLWKKIQNRRVQDNLSFVPFSKLILLFRQQEFQEIDIANILSKFQEQDLVDVKKLKKYIKCQLKVEDEIQIQIDSNCLKNTWIRNKCKTFEQRQQYFIYLKFKNGVEIHYDQDQFIDEMDEQEREERFCPQFLIQPIYHVKFADLRIFEPSLRKFNWSEEKFDRLEEFLMQKVWSQKFYTSTQKGQKFSANPKTFEYYMTNLCFEGTFIMYRHHQGWSSAGGWLVEKTKKVDFVTYPQVKNPEFNYTKTDPKLILPIAVQIKDFYQNINDHVKKLAISDMCKENQSEYNSQFTMILKFLNAKKINAEGSGGVIDFEKIFTGDSEFYSSTQRIIQRQLANKYYDIFDSILKILQYNYKISMGEIQENNIVRLNDHQIDYVIRDAVIDTYQKKLSNNEMIRIPGKKFTNIYSTNDQVAQKNIYLYQRNCWQKFKEFREQWLRDFGHEFSEKNLRDVLPMFVDSNYWVGSVEFYKEGEEYKGIKYKTRHYERTTNSSKLNLRRLYMKYLPYLQDTRAIYWKINLLCSYYVGIDALNDTMFNQCSYKYAKINDLNIKTYNYVQKNSKGFIFGSNNEIVYHDCMSLQYTVQLYNTIVLKIRNYDYNPFDQTHRLSFYDFASLNSIKSHIFAEINRKFVEKFRSEPISEISYITIYQQQDHENILDSLSDVRSCTFAPQFKMKKLMGHIESIQDILSFHDGQYLTPHFLLHFDFNDQYDHEALRIKVHYFCVMLGFRCNQSDITGNAEMEQDIYEGKYIKYGLKFSCRVGLSTYINCKTLDNKRGGKDPEMYQPCPFYVRYQRLDPSDRNSCFFLNDFNLSHSHPLELSLYLKDKPSIQENQKFKVINV